ncbi:MAG: hypothetical protein GXX89_04605 [Clostridiales bacterium]|nr:hypothetical protein [Clostridiales bacterium]
MWLYDKKLEYPVKIKNPDPRMAKLIITQYGGPDGELAASLRYLSQRFSMVTPQAKGTLNDIGTEGAKWTFPLPGLSSPGRMLSPIYGLTEPGELPWDRLLRTSGNPCRRRSPGDH